MAQARSWAGLDVVLAAAVDSESGVPIDGERPYAPSGWGASTKATSPRRQRISVRAALPWVMERPPDRTTAEIPETPASTTGAVRVPLRVRDSRRRPYGAGEKEETVVSVEQETKAEEIKDSAVKPMTEEAAPAPLPDQHDFYKMPARFGHVPVAEEPLGWEPKTRFEHLYPHVRLPTQVVERFEFGSPLLDPNKLFFGDNLHVMRSLPSESVDLIYIDPPFFSQRTYNVLFGGSEGDRR